MVSMTGFGRGEAVQRGIRVDIELSTVNRKQLDIRLHIPRPLSAVESRVHELIQSTLSRGHVTGAIHITHGEGTGPGALRIDEARAREAVRALRKTAQGLALIDDLSVSQLLAVPGVVVFEEPDIDADHVWPVVKRALMGALAALVAMRKTEGAALAKDINRRLAALGVATRRIKARAPASARAYAAGLKSKLAGLVLDSRDPHVLREVVLFADRADITEEIVRLQSHLNHAAELIASSKPVGRALDFVCQELLREINTIGSKSSDVKIARQVIAFKTGLENVREQIQNIE